MVKLPNSIGKTGRPVESKGIGWTNFLRILTELFRGFVDFSAVSYEKVYYISL